MHTLFIFNYLRVFLSDLLRQILDNQKITLFLQYDDKNNLHSKNNTAPGCYLV